MKSKNVIQQPMAPVVAQGGGKAVGGIIIIVLFLFLFGGLGYYFYNRGKNTKMAAAPNSGTGGNSDSSYYANAATLNKIKSGNYKPWSDGDSGGDLQSYWNAERQLFGTNYWTNPDNQQKLDMIGASVDGWFKGMNLYRRSDYVNIFKDDIKRYLSQPGGGLPHWSVQVGEFL